VSELVLELKRSRPAAPAALRERIAELGAQEPEPRGGRAWSLPNLRSRRLALVLVPAALALAVLGALAGGLASSGSSGEKVIAHGEASGVQPRLRLSGTRADLSRYHDELAPAVPSVGTSGGKPLPPNLHRYQNYAASMRIRLDDVDGLSGATQRAMRLARRLGGYVVSVQYGSSGSKQGSAYLTLRVPVARVQSAVVTLSQLGTILSQNVRITDVQQQVNGLERQIIRLTSDIAAIDAQLRSANLTAAERTRLEFRRERLATARRQAIDARRATINHASFATVSLDLTTQKAAEKPAPPGRFHRIIGHAGGILAAEAAWTLLVLAVALPFVVLIVLLIWGARTARRLADRRLLESQ
jgi:Domain of unknown function (DUF4349)